MTVATMQKECQILVQKMTKIFCYHYVQSIATQTHYCSYV